MAPLRKWDDIMPQGPMLRALCLGNEAYTTSSFEKLPNCVNDAASVNEMVNTVPACEAEFKINLADKKAMKTALVDFLGRASARPPRVLLFYFSGHGVQTGDQLGVLLSRVSQRVTFASASLCLCLWICLYQ